MPTKLSRILTISLFALSLSGSVAFAWTAPTLTPPNGNIAEPINTGGLPQTKEGDLTSLGLGTIWDLAVQGFTTLMGNVGVGTTDLTDLVGNGNLKVAGKIYGDGSGLTGLTKSMVGLGNVTNTSDADKPVSTAQQTELNLKASLASPTFTGTVTTPAIKITGGAADGKVWTSSGTDGSGSWAAIPGASAEADGIIGNEVTGVTGTDTTLTRSGSGTGTSPYTLKLNLGNTNSWTGAQTFGENTNFPSGIWNTSGNVGIGTTNPGTYKLNVNGGPALFSNEIYMNGAWSTTYGPRNSGDPIKFTNYTGGELVRIDTAGNVGIGTATPGAYKLNVAGNTNITGNLDITGDIVGGLTTKGTFWDLISGSLTADTITTTGNTTIGGTIRVGTAPSDLCNTNRAGTIRYSSSNNYLELCNGTKWKNVALYPDTPIVTLSVAESPIGIGQSTLLAWSVDDASSSCTASGGWSGVKSATGGSTTISPISATTYILSCANNSGTGSNSVTLDVKQWMTTTGEGNLGESCNAWLARTGQSGVNFSVPQFISPSGTLTNRCSYVTNGSGLCEASSPDWIGATSRPAYSCWNAFLPQSYKNYVTQTRR